MKTVRENANFNRSIGHALVSMLAVPSFLCMACTSGQQMEGVSQIQVEYCDSAISSDWIVRQECRYIQFSPEPDAIIKHIDRIGFDKDRIFVWDNEKAKIIAFDGNGRYVDSTQRYKGKGHNEYVNMLDMAIDHENHLVYGFCDFPQCVMIFDYDLNLREKRDLGFWTMDVATDKDYIYCMLLNTNDGAKSRIVALPKKGFPQKQTTVIETTKGVQGLFGFGKCLTSSNGNVYACLPYEHVVHEIQKGKIRKSYDLDFGELAATHTDEGLDRESFYAKGNSGKIWSVHNVAASDSLLLFNTNKAKSYVMNTKRGVCRSYSYINRPYQPFMMSTIIPAQGIDDAVVFEVPADDVSYYPRAMKRFKWMRPDSTLMRISQDFARNSNAVIGIYQMK